MTANSGKVALVTAGGKRIGAAISEGLHAHGYSVVVHFRRPCKQTESFIESLNERRTDSCLGIKADLADESVFVDIRQSVNDWKGRLDLLINNASEYYETPFGGCDHAQWNDLFASNACGPFFLSQELLPLLKAHNGCIINMLDAMLHRPSSGFSLYHMAKAALQSMTIALAKELAPVVRVNGISPGAILWPGDSPPGPEKAREILAGVPMGRTGDVSDIARTVLFLAQSPYITGQIIAVDGGRSI